MRLLQRTVRVAVLKTRRGKIRPRRLAMSTSVGVFVAMLPIPGCQTFAWLAMCAALRVDPVISYAFTWVSNPVTVVPLTILEMELGTVLCTGRFQPLPRNYRGALSAAAPIGLHVCVGALLVSIVCALLAFLISFKVAQRITRQRPTFGVLAR